MTRDLSSDELDRAECELFALIRTATVPLVIESHHAGWERPWRSLTDESWRELFHAFGKGILGARIETSTNREFARRFGLEVIPAVLVLLEGLVVARLVGRVQTAAVAGAVRGALDRARAVDVAKGELEGLDQCLPISPPMAMGASPSQGSARSTWSTLP